MPDSGVDYCHIIALCYDPRCRVFSFCHLLSLFEFSFSLIYWNILGECNALLSTLTPDTIYLYVRFPQFLHFSQSLSLVSQKCHRLFDNDQFVLIPSHAVIQELKKHKRGQSLPYFDNVCRSLALDFSIIR